MGNKRSAIVLSTLLLASPWIAASPLQASPPQASGNQGAFRYAMSIEPASPVVGTILVLELEVEGIAAASARVEELRLDRGLSLESQSVRPIATAATRGAAFRFGLRVLEAGARRIASLKIVAAEGRLALGPIIACEAVAESSAPPPPRSAWRWVAPAVALRYQAFEARLEPEGLDRKTDADDLASFVPPAGSSFEPSGALSWTVIAFEEGELDLPAASLGRGGQAPPGQVPGASQASRVAIKPLPPGIRSSRAIGSFALSLKGPDSARAATLSAMRFRLILEGRGNLPALLLPEPLIRQGGAILPRGEWASSRIDSSRAEGGSYIGTTSLVVDLVPKRPGLLSIRFPPMPSLDPASGIRSLEVAPLEILVARAAPGPLEGGRELAWLYGELRREPPLSREGRAARDAALARASELGTYPPMIDALPPPGYFIWPAFPVAFTGLALFIVSRLRARKARTAAPRGRGSRLGAVAIALAALSLALGAFGLAASAERDRRYAVIWAESIQTVPSPKSALPIAIVRGSTGRERGSSGPYVCVVLADGVEGWAPRESLFWY